MPTDDQSRQIMLAYTAFYNYTLTDPSLAEDGLRYANAMEDFLAERIRLWCGSRAAGVCRR